MTFDPQVEARRWLHDQGRDLYGSLHQDSLTALLEEAMRAEREHHEELFAAAQDMVMMRPQSFKRLTNAVCEAAVFRADAIRARGEAG